MLERALALSEGPVLDSGALLVRPNQHPGLTLRQLFHSDWQTACASFQAAYMRDVLARSENRIRDAARLAGLSTRAVYKIIHRAGIRRERPTRDGTPSRKRSESARFR